MCQQSPDIIRDEVYLALCDVEVEADIFVMRPLVDLEGEMVSIFVGLDAQPPLTMAKRM